MIITTTRILLYFLIFLLLISLYFVLFSYRTILVKGKCGLFYSVMKKDATQASDILCEVNTKCKTLIRILLDKYPNDIRVKMLSDRYDNDDLEEHPREAFTMGKGRSIGLCLRNDDGTFVSINTLMYVVIHELAHIFSVSYGHPEEFWKNYKWLINEAISSGVYTPVNYKLNPVKYCSYMLD